MAQLNLSGGTSGGGGGGSAQSASPGASSPGASSPGASHGRARCVVLKNLRNLGLFLGFQESFTRKDKKKK